MAHKSCIGCEHHIDKYCAYEAVQHPDEPYELERATTMRHGFLFGLIKGKCGREGKLRKTSWG